MKQIKKPKGISGPDGLIGSVIGQAVNDALRGKPVHKVDALRYLRSETYQSHLAMLNKPVDWLPQDQD